MSMNRMTYDECAYKQNLEQSISPLSYVLDPIKYNNCNKCRMELGIVAGTAVSHISGNMVDLENDLRGQNRPNTHCPNFKYAPTNETSVVGKEYIKPIEHPSVDTNLLHLPPCQMINYGEVPAATFQSTVEHQCAT